MESPHVVSYSRRRARPTCFRHLAGSSDSVGFDLPARCWQHTVRRRCAVSKSLSLLATVSKSGSVKPEVSINSTPLLLAELLAAPVAMAASRPLLLRGLLHQRAKRELCAPVHGADRRFRPETT